MLMDTEMTLGSIKVIEKKKEFGTIVYSGVSVVYNFRIFKLNKFLIFKILILRFAYAQK